MSENKRLTINYKVLQGIATYLRRGGIFNNQINQGLLMSLPVKIF